MRSSTPRTRTRSLSQPPAPTWRCLELADLPTLSRCSLLFQPQILDPMREGLPSLNRIAFLDEHVRDLPLLPPCPSGWRRGGMRAGTWRMEWADLGWR